MEGALEGALEEVGNEMATSEAQKSRDFQGPPLPMPLAMYLARLKTITYRAI